MDGCHGAHTRGIQGHADEDINSNEYLIKTSRLDMTGQGRTHRQDTPGITSRPDEIKLKRQELNTQGN